MLLPAHTSANFSFRTLDLSCLKESFSELLLSIVDTDHLSNPFPPMDSSIEPLLQALPQWRLKDVCRALGLRSSGTKTLLRSRVVDYMRTPDGQRRMGEVARMLAAQQPATVEIEPENDCVCRSGKGVADLQCEKCKTWQHSLCLGDAVHMSPYECPKCQTAQMDPFEPVLDFLLLPTLVPTFGSGHRILSFLYPPAVEAKVMQDCQQTWVQMRCVVLDKDGYTHQWPEECEITLDGRPLYSTVSQQHQSRKRRDSPLDCSFMLAGLNHKLECSKKREECSYALSIVLTKKINAAEAIDHLYCGPTLTFEEGRQYTSSLLSGSADISTSSFRLSLRCPLTHSLAERPVRGWRCKHPQCFDFESFILLQASTKVNKWKCPVCLAHCSTLVHDRFVQSILDAARRSAGCGLVEFTSDGTARLVPTSDDESGEDSDSTEQPRKVRKTDPFDWKEFLRGAVPTAAVQASPAYCKCAQIVTERHRIPPPIDPRPVRARRPGSQDFPIDLDL